MSELRHRLTLQHRHHLVELVELLVDRRRVAVRVSHPLRRVDFRVLPPLLQGIRHVLDALNTQSL